MLEFVKVRNLTQPGKIELIDTLHRLTELLQDSGESAQVQGRFIDDEKRTFLGLKLEKNKCEVLPQRIKNANLEVITRTSTWLEIANGTISPIDALIQGKLRIRGDVELCKRLLQHIAAGPGIIDPC